MGNAQQLFGRHDAKGIQALAQKRYRMPARVDASAAKVSHYFFIGSHIGQGTGFGGNSLHAVIKLARLSKGRHLPQGLPARSA